MTAQDIINRALIEVGAMDPGESPSSTDSSHALDVLNKMLDSWSTERLYVFTTPIVSVNLINGTASYALGVRPVKIESANGVYTLPGGEVRRSPLQILSAAQWSKIPNKGMTSATLEDGVLYCDYGYSTATVYLAPVPAFSSGSRSLELFTWQQLTQFANLSTDNSYPPGYLKAIIQGLAFELAPSFAVNAGQAQLVMRKRDEAVAAIRALNGQLAADPNAAPPSSPATALPQ